MGKKPRFFKIVIKLFTIIAQAQKSVYYMLLQILNPVENKSTFNYNKNYSIKCIYNVVGMISRHSASSATPFANKLKDIKTFNYGTTTNMNA